MTNVSVPGLEKFYQNVRKVLIYLVLAGTVLIRRKYEAEFIKYTDISCFVADCIYLRVHLEVITLILRQRHILSYIKDDIY